MYGGSAAFCSNRSEPSTIEPSRVEMQDKRLRFGCRTPNAESRLVIPGVRESSAIPTKDLRSF